VFIINDITGLKKKERERMQAERLLSLAKLIAGLAHELKNPLNSLTIHAQLLKKMLSPGHEHEQQIEFSRINQSVNIILEEIQRMSKIVDQFILAARPSRPSFEMHNINSLVQRIAEFLGPELELKGIHLRLDLDPEIPMTRLDEHQMRQALLNIVRNSIEAIETPHGQIEIKTTLRDDSIQIHVRDNGCGIPEQDQGKVFEPYYTKKFSGSGLGLMVVYRVIREHNGGISLKSQPGQGTTFTITLPLTQKPLRLLAERSGKRQ
jgi:two-component system, sporulation sensor kinase E